PGTVDQRPAVHVPNPTRASDAAADRRPLTLSARPRDAAASAACRSGTNVQGDRPSLGLPRPRLRLAPGTGVDPGAAAPGLGRPVQELVARGLRELDRPLGPGRGA